MNAGQGRGSTEIDILEIMSGEETKLPIVKHNVHRPYVSMTLQMAPGVPRSMRRPEAGTLPEWGFTWYDNITYGPNVSVNPFFYGTYLSETKSLEPVVRTKKESYQCDALSSMMTLDKSFWEKMHRFRLEWQPGTDGYVHWYVDDEYMFGVEAAGLGLTQTQIPNEPSYVIINTAISTSWGFPDPPWGCTEYDCKVQGGQCGMFPGFCEQLPATFEVNYIRIYQNKDDPKQTVGCNPRGYPTRKFIKAHEYRYKALVDVHAIKPIINGNGHCQGDFDCGDKARGVCSSWGRCKCHSDWTGPHCLSPNYHDDGEDWDKDTWVIMESPFVPSFLAIAVTTFLALLIWATFAVVNLRKKQPNRSIFSFFFQSV